MNVFEWPFLVLLKNASKAPVKNIFSLYLQVKILQLEHEISSFSVKEAVIQRCSVERCSENF